MVFLWKPTLSTGEPRLYFIREIFLNFWKHYASEILWFNTSHKTDMMYTTESKIDTIGLADNASDLISVTNISLVMCFMKYAFSGLTNVYQPVHCQLYVKYKRIQDQGIVINLWDRRPQTLLHMHADVAEGSKINTLPWPNDSQHVQTFDTRILSSSWSSVFSNMRRILRMETKHVINKQELVEMQTGNIIYVCTQWSILNTWPSW